MSQTLQIVITVNYNGDEYAAHLGAGVLNDRDLPTRVAQSITEVLEDPCWDVPRGTVVRVSDWWVR